MRATKTIYNAITGNVEIIDEGIADLEAYLGDLGFLRRGLVIHPNIDMTFNLSAGSLKGYVSSNDAIQTFNFSDQPNASFIILDALTGNPLSEETNIVDSTLIDDGKGNQTTLSRNNRVGLIEFYQSLAGQLYMLYGQIEYNSINIAKRDYIFENKIKPTLLNSCIRIGAFLLRKNTSSLKDVNVVQIPINDRGQLIGNRPDAFLPDAIQVQEWTIYTPTLTNVDLRTGTNYAEYKVVGNSLYINGRIKFNGEGSVTGLVTIALPSGFQRKSAEVFCIGSVTHHDPNVQWGTGSCKMETDTTFTTITADGNSTGINPWSDTWWGNGGGDLEIGYQCIIPI